MAKWMHRIFPGIAILLVYAGLVEYAKNFIPYSQHMPDLQVVTGLFVLVMANYVPIHNGISRFRFLMAAQLPLLLYWGLYWVLLAEGVLLVISQTIQWYRTRSFVLYYPRILSAIVIPSVAASALNLLGGSLRIGELPSTPVILLSIAVFWALSYAFHFIPGPRTIVHPWKPVRGWLLTLVCIDALIGSAAIAEESTHSISSDLTATIQFLVMIIGIALYADASIRRARLLDVAGLTRDLTLDMSLNELSLHVFQRLEKILIADVAVLWVLDEDLVLRPHYVHAYRSITDPLIQDLLTSKPAVPIGSGLIGFVASSRDVVYMNSPKAKSYLTNQHLHMKFGSAMAAPIVVNDQVLGVIALYHGSALSVYTRREKELLKTVSLYMSGIVSHIWRYEMTRLRSEVDELTDLYNYRYFEHALQTAVSRSEQSGHPITLLIIDIDYFKHVNDEYGHLAGNQVLQQLARTLVDMVRETDTVSRYGGEEFTILLPGLTAEEGQAVAERIRVSVEQSIFEVDSTLVDGQYGESTDYTRRRLRITLSIGVATYPAGADSALTLLRHADRAMYVGSKQNGRNRVAVYV